MSIYYISVENSEFFFTTDHIQTEREGQNIDESFVPVTNRELTHQDAREFLYMDGYKEIPNPDPAFAPKMVTDLKFIEGGR